MASQETRKLALLDLPTELLSSIFIHLPTTAILACQRVNHYFHNLIADSAEIQYVLHRGIATQVDNPSCSIPTIERLNQLIAKDSRWEELTLNFSKSIRVPFRTSGIYDLTGGVYLLGNVSRRELHYTYLPSHPDEQVVWKVLPMEHRIIDMGFCVYEHDLIAVITIQPQMSGSQNSSRAAPNSYEIQLQLHQVSTGRPHPEAKQPTISVMSTRWDRPAVGIEIVGDILVLILAYYGLPSKPNDHIFIYEWKTGNLKMKITAPYHSYSGLLFLTQDIILLPNTNEGRLEFWDIRQAASEVLSPQPFFALALPKLRENRTFGHITCRADPNPTSTFRHSSKPFHADPHHAIAVFHVSVERGGVDPAFVLLPDQCSFVLFVHRSSLVSCLEKFPAAITQESDPDPVPYSDWGPHVCRWFCAEAFPTRWITTTAGQRCIIIPDVPPENDSTPVILLNFNRKDVDKVLNKLKRDSDTRQRIRIAKLSSAHQWQQAESNSQRLSIIADFKQTMSNLCVSEEVWHPQGHIGDNNYAAWKKLFFDDDDDWKNPSPKPQRRVKLMMRLEPLDDVQHCFKTPPYSGLPYTVCSSREKYKFDGVLLDEERILGIWTDPRERSTKINLLHFG